MQPFRELAVLLPGTRVRTQAYPWKLNLLIACERSKRTTAVHARIYDAVMHDHAVVVLVTSKAMQKESQMFGVSGVGNGALESTVGHWLRGGMRDSVSQEIL